MTIYLPIAEISVNILVFLAMGGLIGVVSGMFGVGGGFLMTPLLIFFNIPPAVAVATGANQIMASSFSGALAHFRRGSLDIKLGVFLLVGGVMGSAIGVYIFSLLKQLGQLDLIISLLYVFFLGTVGSLMTIESVQALRRSGKKGRPVSGRKTSHHSWIHGLPLKVRFRKSKLYVSTIPVVVLGFLVGILASVMGVGGGFIMVPAMIYILRVPTNVVIGTSLFLIIFVAGVTTVLQSAATQTVDVVLALVLMIGGVIGAQLGTVVGAKLRGEQLRVFLGLLVLGVCLKMGIDLVVTPDQLYSLSMVPSLGDK